MKKTFWAIACGTAVLDQVIKVYIRTKPVGAVLWEFPGLLAVTHRINTGAAFSLLAGQTYLLAFLSLGLLILIYFSVLRNARLTHAASAVIACLLGGGIGNLADRLLYGGVTDYIRLLFIDFPVFNLADMAITGSIGILMILLLTDTLEAASEEEHGSDG